MLVASSSTVLDTLNRNIAYINTIWRRYIQLQNFRTVLSFICWQSCGHVWSWCSFYLHYGSLWSSGTISTVNRKYSGPITDPMMAPWGVLGNVVHVPPVSSDGGRGALQASRVAGVLNHMSHNDWEECSSSTGRTGSSTGRMVSSVGTEQGRKCWCVWPLKL